MNTKHSIGDHVYILLTTGTEDTCSYTLIGGTIDRIEITENETMYYINGIRNSESDVFATLADVKKAVRKHITQTAKQMTKFIDELDEDCIYFKG